MLAGAVRGEGKWGGEGQVRLLDVDTGRLSGLKYELVCLFELVSDMVRDGIREFANNGL
jgi:hypothetical protein